MPMKPIKLDSLKEMKFTVPVSLLIGLFVIGWQAKDFTIEGLDAFFISEAEGTEIVEQLDKISDSLDSYISKSEIREINHQIQEVNAQVTETQLYIAANGNNDIATARLQDLVARRDALRETKDCLLDEDITNKELCYVE
jgi:hypothetical protein